MFKLFFVFFLKTLTDSIKVDTSISDDEIAVGSILADSHNFSWPPINSQDPAVDPE